MNYLKQINGFWIWRKLNAINHSQMDLYFAILDCANTAQWRESFSVPNSTLMNLCGLSKSLLHKTRNQLIQLGLISYTPGKRGHAGSYRIVPLYETNSGTNPETNSGTNPETIYKYKINKKEKKNLRKNVSLTDEEYKSLLEEYGNAKANKILDKLDNYKEASGRSYKDDYSAIKCWVADSVRDSREQDAYWRSYDIFRDDYDHEELEELTRKR